MKRGRIIKICMMACLIFGMVIIPVNRLKVQAAEVIATVQGTIARETTSEMLHLSTKEGKMEIKLDSETDTSTCKLLLPDKKINVSVSYGTDGYLHAVKITSETQDIAATVDAATTLNVSGTIGSKTKDNLLYLNTAQGEMQIKLDAATNMSGCSVLVMGKTYYVTCARGSDAYLHAVSISDKVTTAPAAPGTVATASVTGTVSKKTTESILYLSTRGGEMQFVIDSNADTGKGMVHTPGNQLTVSYYHGSDAYLHAVTIVGVKDSAANTQIDTSTTMSVTGTVESKSNENILYLKTTGGTMELKLDAVNSLNNCKVLTSGRKLTVSCSRGSDAYQHAIDITAN